MGEQGLREAVRAHAARVFPGRALETLVWDEGGVVANLPELAVVRVAPAAGGPGAWIHLTAGASVAPLEDGYGIELVLLTPAPDKLALKLLAMVANLHADERYPLSLGQTLEVGHGWLPGASADHLLVALPTSFDPELEWLSDRERNVRFIWLVPITRREADFARKHGPVPLQEKLGAARADLTALVRDSVI
ncbi:MAG: suppressor of fused domain protein [Solirubrobacteraceae bacterium]